MGVPLEASQEESLGLNVSFQLPRTQSSLAVSQDPGVAPTQGFLLKGQISCGSRGCGSRPEVISRQRYYHYSAN